MSPSSREHAHAPRAANVPPNSWTEANWQHDWQSQRRAPPPPPPPSRGGGGGGQGGGNAPPQQAWAQGGGGGGGGGSGAMVETRRLLQSQYEIEGADGRMYRGSGCTTTTFSSGAATVVGTSKGTCGAASEPLRRPASRPSSAGVRSSSNSGANGAPNHHTYERPGSASAKTRATLAPPSRPTTSGPAGGGYVTTSSAFSRRLAETGEVR